MKAAKSPLKPRPSGTADEEGAGAVDGAGVDTSGGAAGGSAAVLRGAGGAELTDGAEGSHTNSFWKALRPSAGAAFCSVRRRSGPVGADCSNSAGRGGGNGALSTIWGTSRLGGSGISSGSADAVKGGAASVERTGGAASGAGEGETASRLGSGKESCECEGCFISATKDGSIMMSPNRFLASSAETASAGRSEGAG